MFGRTSCGERWWLPHAHSCLYIDYIYTCKYKRSYCKDAARVSSSGLCVALSSPSLSLSFISISESQRQRAPVEEANSYWQLSRRVTFVIFLSPRDTSPSYTGRRTKAILLSSRSFRLLYLPTFCSLTCSKKLLPSRRFRFLLVRRVRGRSDEAMLLATNTIPVAFWRIAYACYFFVRLFEYDTRTIIRNMISS